MFIVWISAVVRKNLIEHKYSDTFTVVVIMKLKLKLTIVIETLAP